MSRITEGCGRWAPMPLWAVAVILAAGLALGGCGAAPQGVTDPTSWQRRLAESGSEEGTVGERRALRRFSALRSRPERVPVALRRRILETVGGQKALRLRFDAAQRLPAPGGEVVWLLPARGTYCLVRGRTAATACTTAGRVAKYGLLLVNTYGHPGHRPRLFVGFGLAPDFAARVKLRVGKHLRLARVRRSVYVARSRVPIDFVGFVPRARRTARAGQVGG